MLSFLLLDYPATIRAVFVTIHPYVSIIAEVMLIMASSIPSILIAITIACPFAHTLARLV
jgi:hypothetical protein